MAAPRQIAPSAVLLGDKPMESATREDAGLGAVARFEDHMNEQQIIAIKDPCFEAEETTKLKFGWRLPKPQDNVTALLTANIGLE